jgi:hypothetical protein
MGEQSETILNHFSAKGQRALRFDERENDFKSILEGDKLLKLFRGGRQGDKQNESLYRKKITCQSRCTKRNNSKQSVPYRFSQALWYL